MRFLMLVAALLMGGCAPILRLDPDVQRFYAVAERVAPVAEEACLREAVVQNCAFLIRLDGSPNEPPNAFQTLDRRGRPVILFTWTILKSFRNDDELAFVMSHEAAHHIRGHIAQQRLLAAQGAQQLGDLVTQEGGSPDEVENAKYLGAIVGARSYSKAFELEADALGAVIAHLAGYSPRRGSAYFEQIPDPGDRFLGSHPSNPERVRVVAETIEAYGLN